LKIIDQATYQAMREGAEILEADGHGEKVLRLCDGNILKLFRRKRLLSSALWSPYAKRFAKNAGRLQGMGIGAPKIIALFRIPSIERDGVLYDPIPGDTLRHQFRKNPSPADLAEHRQKIARFISDLYQKGIYFRSLHLGNIVETPAGPYGLIDISDLRFLPFPLPRTLRQRNVSRLLRISEPGEDQWIDTDAILHPRSLSQNT